MTELKLIKGGAKEPAPSPVKPTGTPWWEYAWLFAVSGIVWMALGCAVYKWFSG